MAYYCAADVKEPARAHRRRHDGLQEGADETNGDIEAASTGCAPRAWPLPPRSRAAPPPKVWSALPSGTKGVAVEVNSETDFVAKNDQFQDFVRSHRSRAGAGVDRCRSAQGGQPIPAAAPCREADATTSPPSAKTSSCAA
jgi:hypothetical protein